MANPNLQMNIPQQIQISAPHPLIFQKPEGHIIYQNGQNILMNGQYAQIASIAQHNMNNNYHALNLGPLNPAILNSAPQILQYSMSTVQQSSIDPNDQNIQKIAKIPPSFLPIASNSVSQILPNPLAISNKAQKPLQNGPNPQQIIPKVAKKYLLNGKQINVPPPGVQAIMDQPSPKIGAQIMIPMQNLQISNGGSSTPTLLSTNPFRDNASPPVRVPSVSKTPIVLPDVRIPPPKPPIHVEGISSLHLSNFLIDLCFNRVL